MSGRVEVITGPMFSGKSTELLRRLRLAQIARKKTAAFKHAVDTRYAADEIATHEEERRWAMAISDPGEILEVWHARGADVIGIDEAQFFDRTLIEVVERLADQGKRVLVAGLNQDAFGQGFGPMPELMARADEVYVSRAVCMVCGGDATRSFRKPGHTETQVLVGTAQEYEARCRGCWLDGQNPISDPAPPEPAP